MVPYLLMIVVGFIFSYIAKEKKRSLLVIGNSESIINNNLGIPMFFLLLLIILSVRDITIGRDTLNYFNYFERFRRLDFTTILQLEGDKLYYVLNWLVGKFTDSFQVFLTVVAAITVIPMAILYSKDRRHSFLKIILFMNMSVFIMMFSGLRQSLAVSFGLLAYEFVKRKKPIPFLLIAILALGMHHTAFMVLFMYPLYHLKLKNKNLYWAVLFIVTVFIFNKQIFSFLTNVSRDVLGESYNIEISSTGAYTFIILFVVFVVFSYIIPDETKMDEEAFGLRNYLMFALLLQCFAPLHNLSMRLNYYYIIFIPVSMPKFISYAKEENKSIAKVAEYIMIAFFLSYYLYNTYISCSTGVSSLDTYPYIPFWQN